MTLIESPRERGFNAKDIDCPACGTPAGQQCKGGQGNCIERGRQARWKKLGIRTDVRQCEDDDPETK